MNATTASQTATLARRRSNTTHRWIRQIHLWIGAWGALAAVIYGFTGLVMNHRFGDGAWPQGDSEERARVCSFFWLQSMIRSDADRALLFDLDSAIQRLPQSADAHSSAVQLTGVYHNLLRRLAEM